jgi:hypothetical protein
MLSNSPEVNVRSRSAVDISFFIAIAHQDIAMHFRIPPDSGLLHAGLKVDAGDLGDRAAGECGALPFSAG